MKVEEGDGRVGSHRAAGAKGEGEGEGGGKKRGREEGGDEGGDKRRREGTGGGGGVVIDMTLSDDEDEGGGGGGLGRPAFGDGDVLMEEVRRDEFQGWRSRTCDGNPPVPLPVSSAKAT